MEQGRVLGRCDLVWAGWFEVGVLDGVRVKLGKGIVSAADTIARRARTRYSSRHTTSDMNITIVIRSEKSVAIRARPKIDGLLSVVSLIPSYRYSPPKRDRSELNHDRLNIIMFSVVEALRIVGEEFWWECLAIREK